MGTTLGQRGLGESRHRLDLDELVAIAQHGDAQKSARDIVISEVSPHDVPDGDEILLVVAGHVDGRLQNVLQPGTRRLESEVEIQHHLFGLTGQISDGHHLAGLVEGAHAGGEDETGAVTGHGGVRIRSTGRQLGWADQLDVWVISQT